MFVLGTAGHIDHGKSVLVRALTGIDPDRLREEKERGMTIDLGFAWLKLPSGREVGIVDVPGHERFIKNMLAGVGGIDLALLIVAANESVMPQTREHLAILDLLEVKRGIVVITKQDLVDAEWLELVRLEVDDLVKPTVLAGAPVLAVSAQTGEGMPELVKTIDEMLTQAEPRADRGKPRLPVDRVFTIAGSGTVVTGTLIDGTLRVGDEVEVLPAGFKTRIRGLQSHKSGVSEIEPGSRVAANLVGLTTEQIRRGDVVTRPGWLKPVKTVTASFRLLETLKRPLKHNAGISFFSGADETTAKLRLLEGGDELRPGGTAWVQFMLTAPMALVEGDHFIVRSATDSLGGGHIVSLGDRRLRRNREDIISNLTAKQAGGPEEKLLARLETLPPVTLAWLAQQETASPAELNEMIAALAASGDVVLLGAGETAQIWTVSAWQRLAKQLTAILTEYHTRHPARPGIPRLEVTGKLKLGNTAALALERLLEDGVVAAQADVLYRPDHEVKLTAAQRTALDAFAKALKASPYNPPSEAIPEPDLVNLLAARGEAVKVSDSVVFNAEAYAAMVDKIKERLQADGSITLGGVRDLFGTSRKYAQALLEHLDSKKITRRVGDTRELF
jgi:selenocysteine-specific elongation factor